MTTKELKSRISIRHYGHGHKLICITFRGKDYKCVSSNTIATDRIGDDSRTPDWFYTTEKQALLSLYNECKRKNNLE